MDEFYNQMESGYFLHFFVHVKEIATYIVPTN
jgi:hypothetical protein